MNVSSDFQASVLSAEAEGIANAEQALDLGDHLAQQNKQQNKQRDEQRRRCQIVLQAIAQVKIVVDEAGLHLIAPSSVFESGELEGDKLEDNKFEDNVWAPDNDYAENFLQLPKDFAKSYLQLQLRNFIYEIFCLAPSAHDDTTDDQALLSNDRVGGGLHVGLLKQFSQSNRGKGYFDPGWQVVEALADASAEPQSEDTLAVKKHGVVVHVEKLRHLPPADRAAQPGDTVAVYLPPYRFEPDCYVAVGDRGPVEDIDQAMDIYLAANAAAMAPIMEMITTALNGTANSGDEAIPYTLQVPYRPEGYEGPEAMVLRVESTATAQVRPLLRQIWQQIKQKATGIQAQVASTQAGDGPDNELDNGLDLAAPPQLRPECPLFAYPLWPGISVAAVIPSTAIYWYGGSADLSRSQLAADALVQRWYQSQPVGKGLETALKTENTLPSEPISDSFKGRLSEPLIAANLAAMQAQFAQAQIAWQEPYRSLNGREGDWFE
jgi:hypothetical protein